MESFQIERSPDLLARFDGPLRDNGKINGKGKGGREGKGKDGKEKNTHEINFGLRH